MHFLRRYAPLTLAALLAFLFGYHLASVAWYSSPSTPSGGPFYDFKHERHFHLLLPATGPNLDFCKLLLSAGILGYPEPVFVGWNGRGMYNGTESHLFKITETLAYLRSLPPDNDGDMVLILDGYDIWLQLRPEVMISRYYDVLAKNDARLEKDGILGKSHNGVDVRSSIVFGPDKIFWPQGGGDAATWAVPESTLPRNAFGPETDTNMFTVRPRWLNSGTIMGTAKEMREFFSATVDMVSRKYDANWEFHGSDQFYFAEVWAEQEVERKKLANDGKLDVPDLGPDVEAIVPEIPAGKRTQYGICLDYESDLFQTAAAFEYHVFWMRFNGSSTPEKNSTTKRIDQWTLKDDVAKSPAPFSASPKDFTNQQGWEDVMLGTNSITQVPFPLFHVTGDKTVRDRWWPRMWFHPHGEKLLKAEKRKLGKSKEPEVLVTLDGVKWKQARPDKGTTPKGPGKDEKGGAWRDDGEYIPWGEMCAAYEDQLYLREGRKMDL